MNTFPLWLQMTTVILADVASFAAIVVYLRPVVAQKEKLLELLRRRFLGIPASSSGQSVVPPPKSLPRAIVNIFVLVVPLLILVGSSDLLGRSSCGPLHASQLRP